MGLNGEWRNAQLFTYLVICKLFGAGKQEYFTLLVRKSKQCLLKKLVILGLLQFVCCIIQAFFANISQVLQGFPFIGEFAYPVEKIISGNGK